MTWLDWLMCLAWFCAGVSLCNAYQTHKPTDTYTNCLNYVAYENGTRYMSPYQMHKVYGAMCNDI